MVGVITGDVINSRSSSPENWLKKIKQILAKNNVPKNQWDIFRGDMFQIEIPALKAMTLAIELKASIKEEKDLDLRMSIGLGNKTYTGSNVLESNGSAFILSGQAFESLKKKNLRIQTAWPEYNKRWNMIMGLALLTMDNWAPITAEIFKTTLQHQNSTQKEIAKKLNKSPSSISEGLTRAGYEEISNMIKQFNDELKIKLNNNDITY